MSLLLSEASGIPTILELIDTLEHSPLSVYSFIAAQAIALLTTSYNNLEGWGDPLNADPSTGFFCWRTKSNSPWAWGGYNVWFPNVSAANLAMHLWAFKVVCLTEIQKLQSRFPGIPCDWPVPAGCELRYWLRDTCIELGVKIVQSANYLLQDRLALFGPLSISFPLTTACQTFEMDGDRSVELRKLTHDILKRSLLQRHKSS
ncbi:Ff.00g066320.m01.CDS01 [Fusarium sp. VM40]|nr:Ff.00g066320.m01.CDS01 [Fusarium sp. VM40]